MLIKIYKSQHMLLFLIHNFNCVACWRTEVILKIKFFETKLIKVLKNANYFKYLNMDRYNIELTNNLPRIAILELSSSGVRIIYVKENIINSNPWMFDFTHYNPDQVPVDAYSFIEDGFMNESKYREFVIPAIRTLRNRAQKHGVNQFYPVGTAAYRVLNKGAISEMVKQVLGNRIEIVTPEEEVLSNLYGFINVKPKYFHYEKNRNYLMIDQGGGSTEMVFFNEKKVFRTICTDLGSQTLKRLFFDNVNDDILNALKQSDMIIESELQKHLKSVEEPGILSKDCIVSGNAIKQTIRAIKYIHGSGTDLEFITNYKQELDTRILSRCYNKGELQNMIKNDSQLNNDIINRLSLPIFIGVMERYKLQRVVLNFVGLQYIKLWDRLGLKKV